MPSAASGSLHIILLRVIKECLMVIDVAAELHSPWLRTQTSATFNYHLKYEITLLTLWVQFQLSVSLSRRRKSTLPFSSLPMVL